MTVGHPPECMCIVDGLDELTGLTEKLAAGNMLDAIDLILEDTPVKALNENGGDGPFRSRLSMIYVPDSVIRTQGNHTMTPNFTSTRSMSSLLRMSMHARTVGPPRPSTERFRRPISMLSEEHNLSKATSPTAMYSREIRLLEQMSGTLFEDDELTRPFVTRPPLVLFELAESLPGATQPVHGRFSESAYSFQTGSCMGNKRSSLLVPATQALGTDYAHMDPVDMSKLLPTTPTIGAMPLGLAGRAGVPEGSDSIEIPATQYHLAPNTFLASSAVKSAVEMSQMDLFSTGIGAAANEADPGIRPLTEMGVPSCSADAAQAALLTAEARATAAASAAALAHAVGTQMIADVNMVAEEESDGDKGPVLHSLIITDDAAIEPLETPKTGHGGFPVDTLSGAGLLLPPSGTMSNSGTPRTLLTLCPPILVAESQGETVCALALRPQESGQPEVEHPVSNDLSEDRLYSGHEMVILPDSFDEDDNPFVDETGDEHAPCIASFQPPAISADHLRGVLRRADLHHPAEANLCSITRTGRKVRFKPTPLDSTQDPLPMSVHQLSQTSHAPPRMPYQQGEEPAIIGMRRITCMR